MRSVVDCCGFSIGKDEPGRQNQDYFECLPETGSRAPEWADFAAVVADGVGSSQGPRDAAMTTARTWLTYAQAKFVENAAKCAGFDDVHFNEITAHAFAQAHEAVVGQTDGSACAAAACLQGDRLIVGSVGDCRIYRVRGTALAQLSEDQVDAGGDPTQVVGGKRLPQAYTSASVRVAAGDVVILCTDGVWKLVTAGDIQQAAAGGGSARDIAARLQRAVAARRTNASDDATAVVALVRRVGSPFWETDSDSEGDQLKDEVIETKVNEVLAELLNRVRDPIQKQNARTEQVLNQLGIAVNELQGEINALRAEAGGLRRQRRPTAERQVPFTDVLVMVLVLLVGVFAGWVIRGPRAAPEPKKIGLQLPEKARVVSQTYENDRILVKFLGGDNKPRLAIFRLEDGGRAFAIIDLPPNRTSDGPVP